MPLATRDTVVAYLHTTYGIRPAKAQELLKVPELADYLLLGELHDSFDYFVAEQIMAQVMTSDLMPAEGTEEYELWIDPEWQPSEEALLDMSELDEPRLADEEDDTEGGEPDDDEEGIDEDADEEFEDDDDEEDEEEDEDEEEEDDEDEDEAEKITEDDVGEIPDDLVDDEELSAIPPRITSMPHATGTTLLSSGNFEQLRGRWDALRAAHLGYDSRHTQ